MAAASSHHRADERARGKNYGFKSSIDYAFDIFFAVVKPILFRQSARCCARCVYDHIDRLVVILFEFDGRFAYRAVARKIYMLYKLLKTAALKGIDFKTVTNLRFVAARRQLGFHRIAAVAFCPPNDSSAALLQSFCEAPGERIHANNENCLKK